MSYYTYPLKHASSADVKPIAWPLSRVAISQALGNSLCGGNVIGGVGRVCNPHDDRVSPAVRLIHHPKYKKIKIIKKAVLLFTPLSHILVNEELTNHNVCLGGSLLNDGRIIEVAVHELDVGVLGLDDLGPVLVADE